MIHGFIHSSCKNHSTTWKINQESKDDRKNIFHRNTLFSSSDIPGSNELFDKFIFFRMIVRQLIRSATREVILQKITIETLEESHSSVHLVCDICTIGILLDEFFYFPECSESLLEIELEFGFIGIHSFLCQ